MSIFSSETQLIDYHGDMNQKKILKLFKNQLLWALTEPNLIIMDNANPYHIVIKQIPNGSWTKGAIQDWLINNNLEFSALMLKSELLRTVAITEEIVKEMIVIIIDISHNVLEDGEESEGDARFVWAKVMDMFNKYLKLF
ncbi:hypothetical protein NQ318_001110 [Aromia moschata]|uniref:Uncharacterized protein n=1 Tax=Aromia moschata TaxID=1265417 RepID=A0AAV8ZG60_9CUCU|nr:hypothetical protein NQ318_001110 [Aromia moschata]